MAKRTWRILLPRLAFRLGPSVGEMAGINRPAAMTTRIAANVRVNQDVLGDRLIRHSLGRIRRCDIGGAVRVRARTCHSAHETPKPVPDILAAVYGLVRGRMFSKQVI